MAGHHKAIRARAALIGALALGLAACGRTDINEYPLDALSPEGPIAQQLDQLWDIVFPIAVVVFVLVEGLILFAVFKFRDRGDRDVPKQVEGNTRLEILWTIIPAVILAGIAVPTVGTIFELSEAPPEQERIDVDVVGKQFFWEFEYPDEGIFTANELVIPTDTPVYLHMDGSPVYETPEGQEFRPTDLVIHSFWVPRLAGKTDFVPGADRHMTIEASSTGEYLGNCAEFCGLSHANMRIRVQAVTPEQYQQWTENMAEPAESPDDGTAAARGEEVFGANCVTCHAVEGHPNNLGQRTGPDLTHFNSRDTFAGAIFQVSDTQQLRQWIRDAPAEKPGAQMTPFGSEQISDDQLDDLIEYLRTLD